MSDVSKTSYADVDVGLSICGDSGGRDFEQYYNRNYECECKHSIGRVLGIARMYVRTAAMMVTLVVKNSCIKTMFILKMFSARLKK